MRGYGIWRDLDYWRLEFEGQPAVIRHELGLLYTASLLLDPPTAPIHALDLLARARPLRAKSDAGAITEVRDPETGEIHFVDAHARLQERALNLDNRVEARRIGRQLLELRRLIADPNESEPIKAEAQRELESLTEWLNGLSRQLAGQGERAVRSVRTALRRFRRRLLGARTVSGEPHPVVSRFAAHLERHLFLPSTRYSQRSYAFGKTDQAGCFTYEPPPGVVWHGR